MTPEQISTITELTIKGLPTRAIGEAIGKSHVAVIAARNKPDVKKVIEEGISKLARRGLNPAVNTLCRYAAMGNTKDVFKTPDIAKLALTASQTIINNIQGAGPQTVINQLIYQQGAHAGVDDATVAMLLGALRPVPGASQGEIIDVCDNRTPVDNPVDSGK